MRLKSAPVVVVVVVAVVVVVVVEPRVQFPVVGRTPARQVRLEPTTLLRRDRVSAV
jgi:hypothetical protein